VLVIVQPLPRPGDTYSLAPPLASLSTPLSNTRSSTFSVGEGLDYMKCGSGFSHYTLNHKRETLLGASA
jgi:hypothetical protein